MALKSKALSLRGSDGSDGSKWSPCVSSPPDAGNRQIRKTRLKILQMMRLMKDRSHDEAMAQLFQADPLYAIELLDEVCREGASDELAVLRRQLSAVVALEGEVLGNVIPRGKF